MSTVLKSALRNLQKEAICSEASSAKYQDVLERALQAAAAIRGAAHGSQQTVSGHRGPRIGIMAAPGRQYVEATLAAWLVRGIAVPLCLSHPQEELRYVLEDAGVSVVLSSPEYVDRIAGLATSTGAQLFSLGEEAASLDEAEVVHRVEESSAGAHLEDGSLIIYTSGTTGRPKGALHTHGSLNAQVGGLCSAWEWGGGDRMLHCLPLHHIHGIVNALLCPLAVGAAVECLPKFSPTHVWSHLQREEDPVTVFMGVPTMYSYLLSAYDAMEEREQASARRAASRLRLTVSGSAACPVPIMQRWEELSGQRLLERYGMTETGMILSNRYRGERKPGRVGYPLPGVTVKSLDGGELAVKGDNLFSEYWNKKAATAESFDSDGFFLTGDTAEVDEEGCWRILGRTSTDIIKSGGYKISALQVEDALLAHPGVAHCAVVGVPHDALGEAITAVISCNAEEVGQADLQDFAKGRLPKYQVPHSVVVMEEIPRNAMGKINKKALRKELFPDKF